MGSRMVMKLLDEGNEVIVWNRSKEKMEDLLSQKKPDWKVSSAQTIEDLVDKLPKPKIIWSMLPSGDATEQVLMGPKGIADLVSAGDVVIDGANSYFEDTERRYEYFENKKILFLGIGVSGGVIAAKEGYPLMIGGNKEAYNLVQPILESLATPNGGHEYFG